MKQMSADTPIFHKCPVNGRVELLNFSIRGDGAFLIYPSGTYQMSATISRKKNQVDLLTLTGQFTFKMGESK